jgi:hypothetical protein
MAAGKVARDLATRQRVEHVDAPRRLVIGAEHQLQVMGKSYRKTCECNTYLARQFKRHLRRQREAVYRFN